MKRIVIILSAIAIAGALFIQDAGFARTTTEQPDLADRYDRADRDYCSLNFKSIGIPVGLPGEIFL